MKPDLHAEAVTVKAPDAFSAADDTAGEIQILTVDEASAGLRLDAFVAQQAAMSRSAAARLIEEGRVTENGAAAQKRRQVKAGEHYRLTLPAPTASEARPEAIPLNIVYEDEDLLVINKPCGMVVHPAPGNPDGTLVNALLYHCGDELSGIGGVMRPGIVHRIDRDTSGLLVVAKNDEAHRGLSAQLSGHHIRRIYFALARGGFPTDGGTVDLPIGRHPTDRKKMAVIRDAAHRSRDAVTHYTVLERFGAVTFLRLELETGRTHQIRVHMAAIGHPLLGDPVYGGAPAPFEKKHAALLPGQCLHAGELSFTHPRTGKEMHFTCPLPKNFEALLALLREAERV